MSLNSSLKVDLAQTANVKRIVISNHHQDDNDNFLDKIKDKVKYWQGTLFEKVKTDL